MSLRVHLLTALDLELTNDTKQRGPLRTFHISHPSFLVIGSVNCRVISGLGALSHQANRDEHCFLSPCCAHTCDYAAQKPISVLDNMEQKEGVEQQLIKKKKRRRNRIPEDLFLLIEIKLTLTVMLSGFT